MSDTPFTDAVDAELAVAWYLAHGWWPKMPADSNFVTPAWSSDDLRPLWLQTNTDSTPLTESMLRRAAGLPDDTRD